MQSLVPALLLAFGVGMAPAAADPVGTGWNQVFSDEFEQNTLDMTKWNRCYPWSSNGCTNTGNNELQWYQNDDVLIENGAVRLRAERRTVNSYNYTSGMIATGGNSNPITNPGFKFQYGFVEMRAKLPGGRGLWPAFWLLSTQPVWPPEIDVMENLGQDPKTSYRTLHWGNSDGSAQNDSSAYTGADLSTNYHTFGLQWSPDSLIWYIDGVECKRFTDPTKIPATEMYLLINLAVGGNWPGSPDATTTFPAYMDIDYVRAWQRP